MGGPHEIYILARRLIFFSRLTFSISRRSNRTPQEPAELQRKWVVYGAKSGPARPAPCGNPLVAFAHLDRLHSGFGFGLGLENLAVTNYHSRRGCRFLVDNRTFLCRGILNHVIFRCGHLSESRAGKSRRKCASKQSTFHGGLSFD